jgi:hypothetical protein
MVVRLSRGGGGGVFWQQRAPPLPFFKLSSSCGLGSGIDGLMADRISRPHPSGTPRAGRTNFSSGDDGGVAAVASGVAAAAAEAARRDS